MMRLQEAFNGDAFLMTPGGATGATGRRRLVWHYLR